MELTVEKTSLRETHTLNNLPKGKVMSIKRINDPFLANKFFSMGLLPGSPIKVVRKLWASSSYYIKSGKLFIALRAKEAAAIEVV